MSNRNYKDYIDDIFEHINKIEKLCLKNSKIICKFRLLK